MAGLSKSFGSGRLRRYLVPAIIVVAVAGAAFMLLSLRNGGNAAIPPDRIAEVRRGSLEETVTALGKLEPKEYVDVGTQVSGQLKKLHAKAGDRVEAGDLLAEIDPRIYLAQMQAQEARLASLQAQFAQVKAEHELAVQRHARNERLIKSQAISREAYEVSLAEQRVAEGRIKALEAQIAEAESTLEGSRTNLEYTQIYAPISGTVVAESAREGQTLNANQTAPVILQLANLDVMTIRAQVAEADVMRLRPGMPAYFTTLGTGDRRFRGAVRQILPSPEVVNEVVLYIVLIDVDNRDNQLMSGMSAQVFFQVDAAENVPLIPVTALGSRVPGERATKGREDEGTTPTTRYEVQVVTPNGDTVQRVVDIGLMTRSMAEVRGGLEIGEKVLLSEARPAGAARPGNAGPRMMTPRLGPGR